MFCIDLKFSCINILCSLRETGELKIDFETGIFQSYVFEDVRKKLFSAHCFVMSHSLEKNKHCVMVIKVQFYMYFDHFSLFFFSDTLVNSYDNRITN